MKTVQTLMRETLRLRFSDNDGDKNDIDSQKVQQASLHSDTNEQPSDLQGDSGTTAAELPSPRDNNSGEDNSSSSDNEKSLFFVFIDRSHLCPTRGNRRRGNGGRT